jgi:uncharacterized repeat protein (TIGR04138 family)
MSDTTERFTQLLRDDPRYPPAAYKFVAEALEFAQSKLGMGNPKPTEPSPFEPPAESEDRTGDKHLTGQELCEAIRCYALEQFGYMAKCVLNSWGIHGTGDFGEIVFNLIRIGKMCKTPDDRREDFDNVFDFNDDLHGQFKITMPKTP